MKPSIIYISQETDPYFNVATEYELLTQAKETSSLFLWQNKPCVVIGRNQSFYAECNMEYLEEEGILPVRRLSGGGAVFQDMGNLNFTFIAKEEYAKPDKWIQIVKKATESLGIDCTFSGRNDLLHQGKKISGHANYCEDGNYMYHGTMMVDVDLESLSKSLNPSFLKLESKGIDSVRSRVTNLKQMNNSITIESLKVAFADSFKGTYGENCIIKPINKGNMTPLLWNKISQKDWILGESPKFQIQVEKALSSGNIIILVNVKDGLIKDIKIHTDSLIYKDITVLERQLIGRLYEETTILKEIDGFYGGQSV